jgi:hypothetical protein
MRQVLAPKVDSSLQRRISEAFNQYSCPTFVHACARDWRPEFRKLPALAKLLRDSEEISVIRRPGTTIAKPARKICRLGLAADTECLNS